MRLFIMVKNDKCGIIAHCNLQIENTDAEYMVNYLRIFAEKLERLNEVKKWDTTSDV